MKKEAQTGRTRVMSDCETEQVSGGYRVRGGDPDWIVRQAMSRPFPFISRGSGYGISIYRHILPRLR